MTGELARVHFSGYHCSDSAVDSYSEHNGMTSYKILSSLEGFSIDHKNGESVSMVYFHFFSVN